MPPKQPYIRGLYRQSQPAIPQRPALLGPIKLNAYSAPTSNDHLKNLVDRAMRPNNYQQIEQNITNERIAQEKQMKLKVVAFQKQLGDKKWRLNVNKVVPTVDTMIHFKEAVVMMKLPEEDNWAKNLKFYDD
ncbi:Hypothetical_protein [Hexamita inflata]|uniref:Hypothetical_protein n=1 Tax=Hexamita inflata TaxID=28002 RepID=A0AA86THW4_9EUKA|nr:Hypothetical protein HINF_LOCUS1248 [Hexamita inflata]